MIQIAGKGALVLVWFLAVPFCLGLPFQIGRKKEDCRFSYTMLAGAGTMMGLFELLAVPMILTKQPYSRLILIYGVLLGALSVLGLALGRGQILAVSVERIKVFRHLPWTGVAAGVLILVQAAAYVAGMMTDLDDSPYVGAAVTAQYTDQMYTISALTGKAVNSLPARYCLSPFPMLLGFLSSATGFSPSVMAHTIEPAFFVALAYGVYSLLGEKLFQKNRELNGWFLMLVSMVHLFSYYSIYTQGTFLLLRIWQGKAFLAAVLLPGIFYSVLCLNEKTAGKTERGLLAVLALSACLVSSMGIMLAPMMIGLLGIVSTCMYRQWKKTAFLAACCIPSLCYAAVYILIR